MCDAAGELSLAGGCRYYGCRFVALSLTNANDVLFQQVDRGCQEHDAFMRTSATAGGRKSAK
jgi:hypothetical protein